VTHAHSPSVEHARTLGRISGGGRKTAERLTLFVTSATTRSAQALKK
jgi:hypothetical protein